MSDKIYPDEVLDAGDKLLKSFRDKVRRIEQLEQQVAELDTKRAMLVAALMQSSGMSHDEIEDMLKQANPPEGGK